MPKPTEPDKIPITSPAQLRIEFDSLHAALALDETEHTWEKIDKAVKRFQAVVRGGAGKKELADDYVRGMRDKTLVNGLIRSLATERTRLSGSTLDLIGSSTRLGPQFAPLLPLYLPTLLRLLCRTNKLYITRSTTAIVSIIKNTKLVDVLRFIVSEWHGESGKSATFREKASEITAYMMSSGAGGEMQIEKEVLDRRIEELEWIIKTAAVDRDAKVRTEAKKCWEVYRREWPERVASFTSPMTPTIRRYLNVNASAPITANTASTSNGSRAPPPVKKPRVPSALSSSVSHAPSHSAPAPSRPAPTLSRSVGPASRPLPSATSHRAPSSHPAPSATSSSELPHRAANSHSTSTMGPPAARTARTESTRSVSNPSSRPASRNEEQRRELSSSTTSLSSSRAPPTNSTASTTAQSGSSFRPTPSTRSGTASSAPPFKPALRTAARPGTTPAGPTVEPRRARRIAQEPAPPVSAPPASAPLPSFSSNSNLSRSTSSTTNRSQTLSSSTSSRPLPAVASSTSAPFRPHKPTTSSLSSKTSTTRTQGTVASARPGPISRPPLTAATASSAARAVDRTTQSTTKARQDQETAKAEKVKADKEKERQAAVAEIAALEAAASKKREQEKEEKDAEELKLREMAEKAQKVPLPVEADESSDEEMIEEEEAQHQEAFIAAESQESVAEEVGMESEYLIESQGSEVPQEDEGEDAKLEAEGEIEVEGEVEQIQALEKEVEPEVEEAIEGTLEATAEGQDEQHPVDAEEEDEEEEEMETEPESPVEEIRLVGDLPPSPFLSKGGGSTGSESPVPRDLVVEEEDREDVSTDSVSTIAPSAVRESPSVPSPLPDVSVALDTLALASDPTETSLLADTTLPRSPFITSAPSAPSFSASTPIAADRDDEFFPTPIQQPSFESLPPLSPEPCQTASIVLETPPRFDDSPARLRLPGRPVISLNFPGRAPLPAQVNLPTEKEKEPSQSQPDFADETAETEEESDEDESDVASPSRRPDSLSRRAIPPPTPLRSVARQRQPIFLPEEASYTDVETSFEEQEETDEESYQVPLNDVGYDDSDSGEVQEAGEGVPDKSVEEEKDQTTPKAQSKFDTDASAVIEQSETTGGEQEGGAEGLEEDDDESRFELERPELRFHDETESEPEVTMEDHTLSESEGSQGGEEGEEAIVEQPQEANILKRSLRSRVVTVDLQPVSAKTPSRNRSREVLGEMQ